jgi:hypothetical protein
MNEIKEYIQRFESLLPVGTSISYTEAEKRAGEFLAAQAMITNWRHLLSTDKIRLLSVQTAVYAQQMLKGTAKTVTENKLTAEASEEYTSAREALEQIENDLSYLKAYYDIFNNAHIFYRGMAKGDNG